MKLTKVNNEPYYSPGDEPPRGNFYVSYDAKVTIPGVITARQSLWVETIEQANQLLLASNGGIVFDRSGEPVNWWAPPECQPT